MRQALGRLRYFDAEIQGCNECVDQHVVARRCGNHIFLHVMVFLQASDGAKVTAWLMAQVVSMQWHPPGLATPGSGFHWAGEAALQESNTGMVKSMSQKQSRRICGPGAH